MEPRIQYAKTADGVSIAYWTMGEGAPLVFMRPEDVSHIALELGVPTLRDFYEYLAREHTLIRYDRRGCGLSTRDVDDITEERLALDLLAVLDARGDAQADLMSLGTASHLGMFFAATYRDRVRRLAMVAGLANPARPDDPTLIKAIRPLAQDFWEDYNQIRAHLMVGWRNGELASRLGALYTEAMSPSHAALVAARDDAFDMEPLAGRIKVPTLVAGRVFFQREQGGAWSAPNLAMRIPGAQVSLVSGAARNYLHDWKDYADVVLPFLDDIQPEPQQAEAAASAAPTGLVTILFTDLASSTALTQRLGDATAQELVRAHNAIVREALATHDGSEIKHTGDGIMASFPTASGALECAVAIQRGVAARNEPNLQVHVGLNAGEPVAEEQDLFGTAVQLARRICDHAASGQILASNVVRELSAGKGFLFSDVGEVLPKGFDDAVRLYEVRWRDAQAL
jgi:class 3 adenylate cyclase